MLRVRYPHTRQQFPGPCLGSIAIVLGKLGLEIGGLHVVFVGRVGVGIDRVALCHRGPHFGVSHHHDIQHAHFFKGKLVLAQFAKTLVCVEHDIAGRRLKIAAQNFHERGFAAAVGADQAIAITLAELDRNIFKQGLRPKLHGDVGGGEHYGNLLKTGGVRCQSEAIVVNVDQNIALHPAANTHN